MNGKKGSKEKGEGRRDEERGERLEMMEKERVSLSSRG